MSARRRSPRSCRCGAAVTRTDHGVCPPCDLRNTIFVLVLARYLRPRHAGAAEFLIRMIDGKADGLANERGNRRRAEREARA